MEQKNRHVLLVGWDIKKDCEIDNICAYYTNCTDNEIKQYIDKYSTKNVRLKKIVTISKSTFNRMLKKAFNEKKLKRADMYPKFIKGYIVEGGNKKMQETKMNEQEKIFAKRAFMRGLIVGTGVGAATITIIVSLAMYFGSIKGM